MAFEKPAPRKTKQEAVATILHLHGGDFLEGKKKYISNTSWPYFRVKLSCVCLKITYKKKSKDKNTIVIYDKMIYYCKLQNVNIQST